MNKITGFAPLNGAQLYYEIAGEGSPIVFIHAGVADNRLWDHQFAYFATQYRVVRYDLSGYGKSEPVDREFSHDEDFAALLDFLSIDKAYLVGCSMGGGIAMNFALAQPQRVMGLVMIGSGPSGLELDIPEPAKFAEAEAAYQAKDWDQLCEIETQIWFDGEGRSPDQVSPAARALAYEMNHIALMHEAKGLGKRKPETKPSAAERLGEINLPVLVLCGNHDTAYILAAADYMEKHIPKARKIMLPNTAHLPSLEQPERINALLQEFLEEHWTKPTKIAP
jgi:pimeloyl-ACP methyl ester carboxylesterase